MKQATFIGAILAILILSPAAFADSILCEKGLVETGTPVSDVLERCGKPLNVSPGGATPSGELVEIWRYEIDGVIRDLYIEREALKTIEDIGLAE